MSSPIHVRPPPPPAQGVTSSPAARWPLSTTSCGADVLWMLRWGGKVAAVGKQGGREARGWQWGRWGGGEGLESATDGGGLVWITQGARRWVDDVAAWGLREILVGLLVGLTCSLRFRIRSRLGQRHGHQNTTLTSLFYKNICWKVIYVYSYESNFQDKSIYMIFTFSNSTT
jgi:hypothetical protein